MNEQTADPGIVVMRFLTRQRIGFKVGGMDRQTPRSKPRMTRWWRIWRGGDVRAVVDYQHTCSMGPAYWQARLRVGKFGFEFSTGPRIERRR